MIFQYIDIIYYIINTWSKIFGPLFTKIAQAEECEIWHSCRLHREGVQNANIFLKIIPKITIIKNVVLCSRIQGALPQHRRLFTEGAAKRQQALNHYLYVNMWSKNFVPLFTKIAQTEEYEIWHSYNLYRQGVENVNIFLNNSYKIHYINKKRHYTHFHAFDLHTHILFCLWPCMIENQHCCYRRYLEAVEAVADCNFEVINNTEKSRRFNWTKCILSI